MKKLESTRKLAAESTLRLYKKGFGYTKVDMLENNDYYMAALASDDFFRSIHEGDVVEAYLWVEDIASYEFETTVIGKLVSGRAILFFSHTENIIRSNERKCLTVQVEIPLKFFIFDTGEDKMLSTEEIVFVAGTVILLTDREAVIKSQSELPIGKFLKGHMKIGNDIVELMGTIDPINEGNKIYNVLFTGMHDRDRNCLLEYIFNIYRE